MATLTLIFSLVGLIPLVGLPFSLMAIGMGVDDQRRLSRQHANPQEPGKVVHSPVRARAGLLIAALMMPVHIYYGFWFLSEVIDSFRLIP